MVWIERFFLLVLAVPAVLSCAYLLGLTLLSARLPAPPRSTRRLKFDIIVPAHNEETGIESTVRSLREIDWDPSRVRIHVVADNCTDDTARIAAAAGAQVMVRQNQDLRGKGYALAHAFEACLAEGWCDAVVVVDADSSVSSNLLEAFAIRIEQGESAIQAHYGIRNPMKSWRTRLMTVAMGAFHIVRSRGRERLKLSSGIRGNGWCVTADLLRKAPYQSFSLTEDLEYGVILGLAGTRVAFAEEAAANGDMVSSSSIAKKQRQRWEGGRMQMMRRFAGRTLRAALRERSALKLDLAFDLLVLPLSYVALNVVALILGGWGALYLGDPAGLCFTWLGLGCLLALFVHVLQGWRVSGTGWRGLTALCYVPTYIVWKVIAMLGRKTAGWVRTEREVS
jgi:cellulose synthase/poly-beta-1,6-N-acetylglucosamine synthase-like glycosyltransferase